MATGEYDDEEYISTIADLNDFDLPTSMDMIWTP